MNEREVERKKIRNRLKNKNRIVWNGKDRQRMEYALIG